MTENSSAQYAERVKRAIQRLDDMRFFRALDSLVVVPVPDTPPENTVRLLEDPRIRGVVFASREARYSSGLPECASGHLSTSLYQWSLPDGRGAVLWLHFALTKVSARMLAAALRAGFSRVIHPAPGGWTQNYLILTLLARVWDRSLALLCRFQAPLTRFFHRISDREGSHSVLRSLSFSTHKSKLERTIECLQAHPDVPLLTKESFDPSLTILVNASLAWGGAERQIVNTAKGLKERGGLRPQLLVEHLGRCDDDDFYLWQLQDAGIEVQKLKTNNPLDFLADATLEARLAEILSVLPSELSQDVWDYATEFMRRRPAVVHAWQDATNVKAGIAAVVLGVPRVILSTRNMAPFRFSYYQDYLRPCYRALLRYPSVKIINNSHAGRNDYASWLGIPAHECTVVHNGIHEEQLQPRKHEDIKAYRMRLGLPPTHLVVGSVFRFYPEKDPLLWIETASRIARARSDVSFLIAGTGVMKQQMEDTAEALGVRDRIYMPGPEKDVALVLGAMNVFMLTSLIEGTPNVLIEAQWLGIPVVATEAGGTEDTLEDGVTGWLVKTRNPDILAERVLKLLEGSTSMSEKKDVCRAFARSRFGLNRMIDETLDVYA